MPAEVLEDERLQVVQAPQLVLHGAVAGAQRAQVVDDLGLLRHLLLDQLRPLLGVEARVEHERRQVVGVLSTEDYAFLFKILIMLSVVSITN